MINCIIVGLGGFLGAVLRYLIGLLPVNTQNGFPVKTLGINIAGAFVIGLVVALGAKKEWNPQLIEQGTEWSAMLYIVLSVAGAVAAVFAAQWIFGR